MKLLYPVDSQICCRSVVQIAVVGFGEVSRNAPTDVAVGLTFGPASISAGLGFGMVNQADHSHSVQGYGGGACHLRRTPVRDGVT